MFLPKVAFISVDIGACDWFLFTLGCVYVRPSTKQRFSETQM